MPNTSFDDKLPDFDFFSLSFLDFFFSSLPFLSFTTTQPSVTSLRSGSRDFSRFSFFDGNLNVLDFFDLEGLRKSFAS